MTPHIPTPLLCPVTSRWRVPSPHGWLYLNANDTRFLALSHPNPLTRPHAPNAYAGPTAESYTTAYNIAAANAAGHNISTDARVHWHYVQDVGPSERWNKQKGECRNVAETGATEGNALEWHGGDCRTTGADGRCAGGDDATVTDATGPTSLKFGGPMEGRNRTGDMVKINGLNWDPARLPLGVRCTRVLVDEEWEGQAEHMGGGPDSKIPPARIALKDSAGNELLPDISNYRNGDKTSKLDASLC